MRIATWNVNSLRSRIDRVEALLQRHDIDVLALQETKAREDQLPLMGLTVLGYDIAAVGHDQWNGVAIISRVGIEDVEVGFPGHAHLGRARRRRRRGRSAPPAAAYGSGPCTCPTAASPATRTTSTSSSGSPRCARPPRSMTGDVALVGDWNIAPQDEDVFDITGSRTAPTSRPPERAAFSGFLEDGYVDVVRPHAPGPEVFTYWDYYRQRYERNRGMRIDFVLGNPSFAKRVTGAFIDREERAGKGASDHAPVIVDLD